MSKKVIGYVVGVVVMLLVVGIVQWKNKSLDEYQKRAEKIDEEGSKRESIERAEISKKTNPVVQESLSDAEKYKIRSDIWSEIKTLEYKIKMKYKKQPNNLFDEGTNNEEYAVLRKSVLYINDVYSGYIEISKKMDAVSTEMITNVSQEDISTWIDMNEYVNNKISECKTACETVNGSYNEARAILIMMGKIKEQKEK